MEGYEQGRAQISKRLKLATPVRLNVGGIDAVIVNYASDNSARYELAWFDRHFWQVRRKWFSRSQFEVIESAADAAALPASAA